MLNLCEIKEGSRRLDHSGNVFHEALKYAENGEKDFLVVNPDGEDYGLEYLNNDVFVRSCSGFPMGLIGGEQPLFPEYFDYDENDRDGLYLDIFDGYSGVYLKDLNEYTAAVAKVLLKYTEKKVYISDSRFLMFLDCADNLVTVSPDGKTGDGKVMTVVQEFVMDALKGVYDLVDSIELFHNVFYHQYIDSMRDLNIKGVIVTVPKTEGIGSILNYCMRMKFICRQRGLEMYVKPGCTRYKDEMLCRYFKLPIKQLDLKKPAEGIPETKYALMDNLFTDAEGNYYVDLFPTFVFTDEYYKTHDSFLEDPENTLTLDVLSDRFISELEEYREAVFKDKKVLGVLVRGSDYIVYNMPEQPMPLEELIPLIRSVKEEGGYDAIFLATEDKDYYKALVETFSKDLIAISQTRISQSELKECIFISELEKARSTEETYDDIQEDSMVNYFYALYLLSMCDGFLGTPTCSGVFMVKSFNKGKFEFCRTVHAERRNV